MRDIQQTSRFRKALKRMKARGADMSLLKGILEKLQRGESLELRHQNHPLTGQWSGNFDCHIKPDWILIYRLTEDALILEAMGTHSDLFD